MRCDGAQAKPELKKSSQAQDGSALSCGAPPARDQPENWRRPSRELAGDHRENWRAPTRALPGRSTFLILSGPSFYALPSGVTCPRSLTQLVVRRWPAGFAPLFFFLIDRDLFLAGFGWRLSLARLRGVTAVCRTWHETPKSCAALSVDRVSRTCCWRVRSLFFWCVFRPFG